MDYKLIKDYGEDILSYRIRTARQKKRMRYEDFDKQLLQIDKEQSELYEKKYNLEWEPLIPPIQRGWTSFFVLRDNESLSKNAAFYENILKKINTYDWSYRKDFKVKQRRFGRKKYVVKKQKLLELYDWQFESLGFTEEEKKHFYPELYYYEWKDRPSIRYVFKEPWRFVLRVRPNMITMVKARDNELESKIRRIANYLGRNAYDRRLLRLQHGYRRWRNWKEGIKYNEKNPLKNKPVHAILDALKEELL